MVELLHVAKRNAVLEKPKISCSEFQLLSASAVYVNEQLCPAIKPLFLVTGAKKSSVYESKHESKLKTKVARKTRNSSVVQTPYTEDILRIVA